MSPQISVVLPVFNGARDLPETVRSILAQTERDYELIIVDDGSTDATPSILSEYAAGDSRIRILRQENEGITRALIRGCDAARAPLIARQDCGDVSHPERFRRMTETLTRDPSCVLASGEVAYLGPEGESLYATRQAGLDTRRALLSAPIRTIVGMPHHGAAVMRTDGYRRVGGYRAEFYFAQDLDLWIRLARLGEVLITNEILYDARLNLGTISSLHRSEQIASATFAIALRDSASEEQRLLLLREVATIRPARRSATRRVEAKALYFIAACLQKQKDPRWRQYVSRALRRQPLDVRSWLLLLRGVMT